MNATSLPLLVTINLGPGPGSGPPAPPITAFENQLALFGYAILFIVGSFGHTSSFLIFLRPTLYRISTSCLFIALTISDSVSLLVSIYDFINIGLKIRDSSLNPSATCRFRNYIQWTAMYFCNGVYEFKRIKLYMLSHLYLWNNVYNAGCELKFFIIPVLTSNQ
jgi:hypothetical protein